MKYKGTLLVVKDCRKALEFYRNLFGLELLVDNDGNMELSGGIYLQEEQYWEKFLGEKAEGWNNHTELYFEDDDIQGFLEKLERLYPETQFVHPLLTHSWGQQVVRFYDEDGNLIEVGTPVRTQEEK
ncbi:MAG: VOC family protein [Spirochaetales bacterium]|nr:VOC family protein [Candidatus Physcosoma equi]